MHYFAGVTELHQSDHYVRHNAELSVVPNEINCLFIYCYSYTINFKLHWTNQMAVTFYCQTWKQVMSRNESLNIKNIKRWQRHTILTWIEATDTLKHRDYICRYDDFKLFNLKHLSNLLLAEKCLIWYAQVIVS